MSTFVPEKGAFHTISIVLHTSSFILSQFVRDDSEISFEREIDDNTAGMDGDHAKKPPQPDRLMVWIGGGAVPAWQELEACCQHLSLASFCCSEAGFDDFDDVASVFGGATGRGTVPHPIDELHDIDKHVLFVDVTVRASNMAGSTGCHPSARVDACQQYHYLGS